MKFPTVDIDDKERDEPTDTLIKTLLDEQKASKKQKREPRPDVASAATIAARKGKTLAEIEAEEGGPIKESLVGMAQTKRAQDRKKREAEREADDTEVVANTERFEAEGLEVEEEEGIKFEPFNLKQEREEGHFDDSGNYVLRKQGGEEGDEEKDAWLNSDEAKVVSEEVRKRIEQQRAADEEAARRGPLTERQIAQRKADMAAVMLPGETVTRALKRLGGGGGSAAGGAAAPPRAMGKRERARLLAAQQATAAAGNGASVAAVTAEQQEQQQEAFSKLTELADELLGEGEMEIYGTATEELQRSARMWLPQYPAAGAAAAGAGVGPSAAGATAGLGAGAGPSAAAGAGAKTADGSDDDMFGDDDDEGGKKAAAGGGAAAAGAAGASAVPAAVVDGDDDMFGDDDEGGGKTGASGNGGANGSAAGAVAVGAEPVAEAPAAAVPASSAAGPGPKSMAPAATEVDYGSWPIKELKRLLQERGVDASTFVEKGDLVAKLKEVLAATGGGPGDGGPGGPAGGGGSGAGSFEAPAGYAFDPSSGYFFSAESGMFYDTSSGGYCQSATGKWFYLDAATGGFVEWQQG